MRYTPVIKARSGSTINTPQRGSKVSRFRGYDKGNPPPKLDFCIENGANNGSTGKCNLHLITSYMHSVGELCLVLAICRPI